MNTTPVKEQDTSAPATDEIPTITITIEDGTVQDVYSSIPLEYTKIDFDIFDVEDGATTVINKEGHRRKAFINTFMAGAENDMDYIPTEPYETMYGLVDNKLGGVVAYFEEKMTNEIAEYLANYMPTASIDCEDSSDYPLDERGYEAMIVDFIEQRQDVHGDLAAPQYPIEFEGDIVGYTLGLDESHFLRGIIDNIKNRRIPLSIKTINPPKDDRYRNISIKVGAFEGHGTLNAIDNEAIIDCNFKALLVQNHINPDDVEKAIETGVGHINF